MSVNKDSLVAWLTPLLKFVFSWIVLMPIAVIITGKLLAKTIKFTVTTRQNFQIPLKILLIQASGGEVVLGFTAFIIMLLILGVFVGPAAYSLVKDNFGIDPGHFNALCMLSSFISVAVSFLIFIIDTALARRQGAGVIADSATYEERIKKITNRERT